MRTFAPGLLIALLATLANTENAAAGFIVEYSTDNFNHFATVTAAPNSGLISFAIPSNSFASDFAGTVITAISQPNLFNNAFNAQMTLSVAGSRNNNTSADERLYVRAIDTNFTLENPNFFGSNPTGDPFQLAMSNAFSGSFTTTQGSIPPLGQATLTLSPPNAGTFQTPVNTLNTVTVASTPFIDAPSVDFALAINTTIDTKPFDSFSTFDNLTVATPAPPSLVLLASGLPVLGLMFLRSRKQVV
jgi:hypothetical protein